VANPKSGPDYSAFITKLYIYIFFFSIFHTPHEVFVYTRLKTTGLKNHEIYIRLPAREYEFLLFTALRRVMGSPRSCTGVQLHLASEVKNSWNNDVWYLVPRSPITVRKLRGERTDPISTRTYDVTFCNILLPVITALRTSSPERCLALYLQAPIHLHGALLAYAQGNFVFYLRSSWALKARWKIIDPSTSFVISL
jgi:hypothetical protein